MGNILFGIHTLREYDGETVFQLLSDLEVVNKGS